MSTENNLLHRSLNAGQHLVGLYNGYAAEEILETIGIGWDFVWIDGQHGPFSYESSLRAVRVASGIGVETLLRVPSHDPGWLAYYADTAASAIMVPQVDTAEIARGIVQALRFPPHGSRSFGGRRPNDVHGQDYYSKREPMIVIQIESELGLANVEQIAAVEGVDALFFGADDMKISLGLPVETPFNECEPLLKARSTTAEVAISNAKFAGCGICAPHDLPLLFEQGYQFVATGADVRFLRSGSQQTLQDSRDAISSCRIEPRGSDGSQ